ncbi:MAG TPA: Ig-like domain-containing protein [Pseudonocardiaceae bacterium]|nr:Ig-like domain-containing protein [Pseudonocardiaceae bacterium]
MWRNGARQWAVPVFGVTLVGAVLAGCTSVTTSAPRSHGTTTATRPPTPVAQSASVSVQPASGARDVSPAGVFAASVANGTISHVALTNPKGLVVSGKLSADNRSWTATEPLGYGKTYTWSGDAIGQDGRTVPIRGAFTTLTPDRQISAKLNVGDGQTYGVAMPIALTFSSPVTDRIAVQRSLTVTTSKPTKGLWAWLDAQTVHWRPETYYAPGTHVTVSADLYGVAFAPGVYGKSDISANFAIGRSQVVRANTKTHRMIVLTNGRKTADYPASFGLDSDPGRVTNSGVHVVLSRSETHFMTNPKYHYFNLEVHWAVRISNNGEFVHAAPWSVGQQGRTNVSHGCVNLSTANALAYYKSVLVGDPVEVTGSTQHLGASDGDYYDWALSWAQWQAKSAIPA